MKGSKVIFAVCLALLGFGNAWATESDDAARAATRRGETNTVTTSRKKSETPNTYENTNAVARVTNATAKQNQTMRERTTAPRTNSNISTVSRTSVTPSAKQISARTATKTAPRATTAVRTATVPNISRAATASRAATRTTAQNSQLKVSSLRSASLRPSVARNATSDESVQNLRDAIMNASAKECREVYYSCMDEFCANKDSQLKRCACSSRLHEFDSVKKQLETAEEKMLDFSQRLLTVSMDAEDAAALNVATEGELAFNQKDTSESKKILDEITKKLNTKFEDSSLDRNLTAISLSLNEDAAFDNIDSLMGASTTLKTGTALYGAALPVCREMAAEVCTPEQLSIAESGYQMMIEQDCNTVKKSYQSQTDAARAKVLENSALLDMSRLSTYQDKNSDDILTCKRKMLDMLSNTSVCGENLTKCLDMTGQYIDPSTGEAFLSVNLANLSKLITRPTANNTWTDMPGNETFVQHLNSKKKFLEPAMEHCQNIADSVWTDFIEDALAQIKLAQDAKLEEVRRSCTTLTTQCLSNAATSLEDFDARALSTFGVIADKTVNAMCADVKNACSALMETTGDDDSSWVGGMTEIATDTTYDTIIKTCREVGRACIIQTCKSISGNFGLCENIETSVNRKAIVNGTSCWQEVLDCVADAGTTSIKNITERLASHNVIPSEKTDNIPAYSFYKELYNVTYDKQLYPAQSDSVQPSSNLSTFYNNCMISGTKTPKTNDEGHTLCYDTNGQEGVCNGTTYTTIVYTQEPTMRCVYDICKAKEECASADDTSTKCKTCRIAERIWGNCELPPTTDLSSSNAHNMILKPRSDETTLLYWFALNTGTDSISDSCRDTTCGPGYRPNSQGLCYALTDIADDGEVCKEQLRITTKGSETNCCTADHKDHWGNCCDATYGAIKQVEMTTDDTGYYYYDSNPSTVQRDICVPKGTDNVTYLLTFDTGTLNSNTYYFPDSASYGYLLCLGTIDTAIETEKTETFPSGNTITCNGTYLFISSDGIYYAPRESNNPYPNLSYKTNDGDKTCTLQYTQSTEEESWTVSGGDDCTEATNYMISF